MSQAESDTTTVMEIDVLIVGSGPAGVSTALHLVQNNADWADRILVLDKATHPRKKLCGGAITHFGKRVLADLGLTIESRSFPVHEVRLTYQDLSYSLYGNPIFDIVDRAEFDHWLVTVARARGIQVREGEAVADVRVERDHVLVTNDQQQIRARTLIAADGSLSVIRHRLGLHDSSNKRTRSARAVEVDVPVDITGQPGFRDSAAVFDFTQMIRKVQGYCWQFPSYVAGRPTMNRGVFDSRILPERPADNLGRVLRDDLRASSLEPTGFRIKGHPIHYYHPSSPVSQHRVLLVGDAAGVDPLFGEGISLALAYGDVAASAVMSAFARDDFSYADYRHRLHRHWLLWQLPWRTRVAQFAYWLNRPAIVSAGWRLAPTLLRLTRWGRPVNATS